MLMGVLAGCNQENIVVTSDAQLKGVESAIEIYDDGETTARIAASSGVFQVFLVTEPCVSGVSQNFAYRVQNGQGAATLPKDSVKSTSGYKTFTVKPENSNKYLKKKFQIFPNGTLAATTVIYMLDAPNNVYKRQQWFLQPTTWQFLPTYSKQGVRYKCSGAEFFNLE